MLFHLLFSGRFNKLFIPGVRHSIYIGNSISVELCRPPFLRMLTFKQVWDFFKPFARKALRSHSQRDTAPALHPFAGRLK